MAQRITIQIDKKIATCLTKLPIVCGNSDYIAEFQFDAEWDEHLVKTARFKVNGEYTDVVFKGNECAIPIILDAKVVWIGVFAGDLSTSTPAIVHCAPCVLDGEDVPAPPREDVYSQIITLCDEAVEKAENVIKRADEGEFDGEKGESGVYILSEGENLEDVPEDFNVVIDPNGDHSKELFSLIAPHVEGSIKKYIEEALGGDY